MGYLSKRYSSLTTVIMASRSNPNTPSRQRPKTARTISKRRNHIAKIKRLTQRAKALPTSTDKASSEASSSLQNAIANGDVKIESLLRTSQALKQARPLSGKKMRKLERKARFDKKRKEEAEVRDGEKQVTGKGEVTMKDVGAGSGEGIVGEEREEMDVDEA